MAKYIVEVLTSFREAHVVEAKSREEAEKIAQNSDYNMSACLGTQILSVRPHSEEAIEQYRDEDEYFWIGVKSVNDEGYLVYTTEHGSRATDEKIF